MSNVMDYLEWRGDLTFEEAPLNEVDNLIFSLLSYVDLADIVPPTHKHGGVTLRRAAMEYFFIHDDPEPRPLGLIIPADILLLFRRMAHTTRFANLELSGYVNEICETREMQFSAITVHLPNEGKFVAFRGTDDTIVGWREDFNLSYMEEVPSQRKATNYLNDLDLPPDAPLYIGGHSKGGNLAVWSAVHANERVRRQIRRVWSNDGPGFTEEMLQSEIYRTMEDRICTLLPDAALIGLLLEHNDHYTVIKSERKGVFQHDGMSWEVVGSTFVRSEGLSKKAIRNDTVVRDRLRAMSREERQTFTGLFFHVLESTGAKTLTELYEGGMKGVLALIRTFKDMSREDQDTVTYMIGKLFGGKVFPADKDVLSKESVPPVIQSTAPTVHPPRRRIRIEWFPTRRKSARE